MKRKQIILFLLTLCVAIATQAQHDPAKLSFYRNSYGIRYQRMQADSVLVPPSDTIYSKTGLAVIDTVLYVGNGDYWSAVSGVIEQPPVNPQRFGFLGEDAIATEDRSFNQNNHTVTLYDGQFVHHNGDYTGFASPWGLLQSDINAFHYEAGSDATHFVGFTVNGGSNSIGLQSEHPDGDDNLQVGPNFISLANTNGNIFIPQLKDSAQSYQIFYNPTNSKITYAAASSIVDGRFGFSGEDDEAGENRDFDLSDNTMTVHDGLFTHGTGDYTGFAGAYSLFQLSSTGLNSDVSDGSGSEAIISTGLGSGTQINLQAFNPGGSSTVSISGLNGIDLLASNGNLFFRDLIDSTQAYQLFINPTNFKVTYALSTVGAGGGAASVFGENGLTNVNDSTLEWGGTFTSDRTINYSGFTTTWTGAYSGGGNVFTVGNTGSGISLGATNDGSNPTSSFTNSGSGNVLLLTGTSGIPLRSVTTTGTAAGTFQVNPSSTNTVVNLLELNRVTSSTAASGLGGAVRYNLEASDGSFYLSNRVISKWTTATAASRVSEYSIEGVDNAVTSTIFVLKGSGQKQSPKYGSGTFTGTATYFAAYDASGNEIEVDAGTVGGVTAEDNTLTTTLTTTGTLTVPVEAMIDYVMVKPASNLTGFKIGIAADDDKFFPATPVTATSDYVVFDVGAYLDASTAVQFSGITSSTDIIIVFKPIHE